MATAAGNDNRDACNYSPASTPEIISVAASDNTDRKATFSNFGKCVTLFAPGVSITSDWIGSPNAINTISGTSMAAPHAAGVAAMILGTNPRMTQAEAKALLRATANSGMVLNGNPNLLLYNDCQA